MQAIKRREPRRGLRFSGIGALGRCFKILNRRAPSHTTFQENTLVSMAQIVDAELIGEDELRSSAGAASRAERRATVSLNFFRFSPVLEDSLLADAPPPPAPLCRLHFRPFLTWAPFVFARKQWWYNYVLPCVILWFMITLMFFSFQVRRIRQNETVAQHDLD